MTDIHRLVVVDGQVYQVAEPHPLTVNSPRGFHTGTAPGITTTQGNDTTPVVTEMYMADLHIHFPCKVTGISLLNGSAAAGNVQASLYDSKGNPIPAAQTASTAQSGTNAYQRIPLVAAYTLLPGNYYVGVQFNSTSARFRSHANGDFGAGKITGGTYGTFSSVTPPTTFTANLGPIVSLY